MPGVLAPFIESVLNAVQFRNATLVYTRGTLTPYSSASFCLSGSSWHRYGIIMFQHASTTPFACTLYSFFSRPYTTSTPLVEGAEPTWRTRAAVLLRRIRTGDDG